MSKLPGVTGAIRAGILREDGRMNVKKHEGSGNNMEQPTKFDDASIQVRHWVRDVRAPSHAIALAVA